MCIWPTMRSWKRWRWGLLLHRRAQPDLLRHYRQVRLHRFLCAHQSRQPPNLPAHRAAPLHLSRFRIRAGEDDAAFFDWRREHHVTVGHDVWIGHNAILMPGVSVGNGAVIGSAAVVTRTWSLTASSPAWRPKDRHALRRCADRAYRTQPVVALGSRHAAGAAGGFSRHQPLCAEVPLTEGDATDLSRHRRRAAGAGVRLRLPDLPTGAARAGISAASVQRHA